MTPKLKVSQRSDRFFGERDVSARATHLKAVIGKVSLTTIERKIMSTKTTIKRLALVAAASLGLGVLSVVPAQAVVSPTSITLSVSGTGSATQDAGSLNGGVSDSTTAAIVSVSFLKTSANDSVSVGIAEKSKPLGATQNVALSLKDTTTNVSSIVTRSAFTVLANGDSKTLYGTALGDYSIKDSSVSSTSKYLGADFRVFLESATSVAGSASVRKSGSYVYTVVVTPYDDGAINTANIKTIDVTITVAVNAALSTTANAGLSSAVLNAGSSTTYATGYVDSTVAAAATASTTAAATIAVNLVNASGGQAAESVTVTTTAGTVGLSGGTFGRSVVLQYSSGGIAIQVRPDGTVGTATISVSSPSVTFASKSVNFYSTTVATLTGTQRLNTLKVGTNSGAFTVVAKDSSGNVVGSSTAVYVYSSNTAVVSETATACSYDSTNQRHSCDLTGVSAGTATISFKDGTGTILGTGGSVTVSTNAAATVKVAFDKATYAPGEKAFIIVSVSDSAGKSNAAGTFTNLFATGGISSNVGFGSGSDTLTAVSIATDKTSAATGYESKEPVRVYTVYMPAVGGTVTLTATGGTSLPAAGQVAVTASASVSDSGASALAAVTALASQVSAFITKINAQITTLTDLVMKIQKKVKA